MPQQISQMSPNKAAAALALMTKLSEGLMPKQMPEETEEPTEEMPLEQPESAPGEEMPQEVAEEPVEESKEDPMKEEYEAKMTEMTDKIGELEMDIELIKKAITNEKLPE